MKYADLSKNRTTDYIFDWDNMLASKAIPLLICSMPIRVCCLFSAKADIDEQALASAPVIISEDREAQLAARLLQFEETLTVVARGSKYAARVCAYLYDVAGLLPPASTKALPYFSAENDAVRNSRLKLAQPTAKTLVNWPNTLGIENRRTHVNAVVNIIRPEG